MIFRLTLVCWLSCLVPDLLVYSVSKRSVQLIDDLLEAFKGKLLVFLFYHEAWVPAFHRCFDSFVDFCINFHDLFRTVNEVLQFLLELAFILTIIGWTKILNLTFSDLVDNLVA